MKDSKLDLSEIPATSSWDVDTTNPDTASLAHLSMSLLALASKSVWAGCYSNNHKFQTNLTYITSQLLQQQLHTYA